MQGDIVGIVDSAGNLVVEYKCDAWGKPISRSSLTTAYETLGRLNPFRYRRYVYDEETGLYYLRSRYYNPEWGRFINADTLLGEVGALGSHNAFAYCVGNPTRLIDIDGESATDVILSNSQTITNLDGPYPIADLVFVGLLACAWFYDCLRGNPATNSTAASSSSSARTQQNSSLTAEGELKGVASRYGNLQCVQAKNAMLQYLMSQNLHGSVIELRFPPYPGFVYSNMYNKQISENGYHVGIEYKGIVYCNVHPTGLPEQAWINDFEAGFGAKPIVTKINF